MFKLCYHVPESHLEATKQALFDAGAGRVGDYDQCCWQVRGSGQFRPLPGSSPFIGKPEELTRIEEYRVEMVCDDAHVRQAVAALKQAHPYEQPSYDVLRIDEV